MPWKDKNKRKEYEKRKRIERLIWYNEIKKDLRCERCGFQDSRCLAFHHKDPSTKIDKVRMILKQRISMAKVLDEIAKCEVLCYNCHRIEHIEHPRKL